MVYYLLVHKCFGTNKNHKKDNFLKFSSSVVNSTIYMKIPLKMLWLIPKWSWTAISNHHFNSLWHSLQMAIIPMGATISSVLSSSSSIISQSKFIQTILLFVRPHFWQKPVYIMAYKLPFLFIYKNVIKTGDEEYATKKKRKGLVRQTEQPRKSAG